MVGQPGVALGKHHRLTAAGEILQLQDGHAIPLARGHLTQFGDHRDRTDLGLVGLLLQRAQADRCQQP